MCGEYINAYILDVPYHADLQYTYFVPAELRDEIEEGTAIVVPFGTSDRKRLGIVSNTDARIQSKETVKSVVSVMSPHFKLDKEMMSLCAFLKGQTLCSFGDAVKCILPPALITKAKEVYTAVHEPQAPSLIYEYIKDNPCVSLEKIDAKFVSYKAELCRLVKAGCVEKDTVIVERDKSKYETRLFLTVEKDEALKIAEGEGEIKLRGKKQAEVLRLLCEYGELCDKNLYEMADTLKSSVDTLIKKGLVGARKVEIDRSPYKLVKRDRENVVLSPEQETAYNTLKGLLLSGEPKAALLYGVTGSGKTSVIKKMIDEAIDQDKGVIVLVPEISLTPQTVDVFCGYYGDRVAVVHSGLSAGERFDTYKKIKKGQADIVIGTRSAVFAPVKNLGMIVIDEEQEHTYKSSDASPKYLAHDVARFRCASNNALMLLASATPSLNSYYKALGGAYTLVKLTKRYGNATLPDVIITDMRKERARGNMGAFGTKLAEYMTSAIDDGKQAILFLNRRGYHSSISCQSCGKAIECPNCSVALTYHSYRRIDEEINADNAQEIIGKSGVLRCHCCGYRTRVPSKCTCGESHFNYVGFGTQKTQQDIDKLFPGTKTLRLDADTTTSKHAYEEILGSFKDKEAQVMIGTQMVTKGHNFPLVTLVGVIMADTMLYTSDYRAAERTFSMLTQVIGRAGRAKDHGVAIIQTNSPNDQTILLSAKQDYESFYENEILVRRAYEFPPFCDIALITMASKSEGELDKVSGELMKRLESELRRLKTPIKAYGPFDAPVYKSNGAYRKRIIIKCKLNRELREIFSRVYIDFSRSGGRTSLSIDFNPTNI